MSAAGSFALWLDAHHPRSVAAWTQLLRRTFRFTGGQIVNEIPDEPRYLPGAHEPDCPVYARILACAPPWAADAPSYPTAAAEQV
jgi:DNA-3-methyladenine glycosylase I